MAIFRGTGSASTTTDQATIDEVTTQATNAATSATNAASSASSASSSATSASSSASTATSQASAAATSASNAASSATDAQAAQTAAEAAQTAAETAETNIASAETNCSTSETNAVNAKNDAESAQTAAEAAQAAAETAQTAAETAESNVSSTISSAIATATADAEAAQTAAEAAQSAAETAETNAETAQTAAETAQGLAETAQTNAETAETNAETAQTAAENALDEFTDLYLGTKASAPTVDNDGDALQTGALYYDSTDEQLYVWDGSAWEQAAFSVSGAVTSFNTRTGAVTLSSGDVTTALGYTPYNSTNPDSYVTQSAIDTSISNLVDSAPATLDTLNELAAALGDDANFSTTVTNSLAAKAPLASPTFTGTVTIPGATTTGDISFGDNDKAIFGDGSDLQIYHDGTNSYVIDNGSGVLRLRSLNGSGVGMYDDSNQVMLFARNGAEVNLRYNGDQKLQTTSTGIDVTGDVAADGLTVDGTVAVNLGSDGSNIVSLNGASAGRKLDIQSFAVGASAGAGYSINATSSAGALDLQTAGNSRLNINAVGDISFYEDTGTTPKLFWDASAESLGIGTSSPNYALAVQSGTLNTDVAQFYGLNNSRGLEISTYQATNNDAGVLLNAKDSTYGQLAFATTGTEAMRIDSSGNVGIGTDNPISGISSNQQGLHVQHSNVAYLTLDNTTGNKYTLFSDTSGNFRIHDLDVPTERMRIDSSGNLLVGTTTAISTGNDSSTTGLTMYPSGILYASRNSGPSYFNLNGGDGPIVTFRKDGASVGSVSVTSSGTTYNTTSDARLKTDIQPIADATDRLMQMNPVSHKWKADPEADAVVGFIAQEMQDIVPEAVSGDPDGDEMMSMDYGRITPVLVAALQDAHKKIEELSAEVKALKEAK